MYNMQLSNLSRSLHEDCLLGGTIKRHIDTYLYSRGISSSEYYLLCNGKILTDNATVGNFTVYVVPRLLGGKGGFGSMLRAIGAQIEKTTNREACRDLSGRRLRDINEEKRLKKWIAEQAEREKEAASRRQKKLEKLCAEPKHEFSDSNYDKERSEMVENVHDAVEQGLKASSSSKGETSSVKPKNKKRNLIGNSKCLWIDGDELEMSDEDEDGDSEDEDESSPAKKRKLEDSSSSLA